MQQKSFSIFLPQWYTIDCKNYQTIKPSLEQDKRNVYIYICVLVLITSVSSSHKWNLSEQKSIFIPGNYLIECKMQDTTVTYVENFKSILQKLARPTSTI